MSKRLLRRLMLFLLLPLALLLTRSGESQELAAVNTRLLSGFIQDAQGQPVPEVEVTARVQGGAIPLAVAESQDNGRYALQLPADQPLPDTLLLHLERPHFSEEELPIDEDALERLQEGQSLVLPDITLTRRITPAFWVATLVFLGMLALIAIGPFHNTLAALVGATVVFAVSYLGPLLHEDLFIFEFQRSLRYIDWNVIFLIMGMMIVIAVVERTGIFQWSAFMAYRMSRGRVWLLMIILMVIAGVASAFLDNVTTMLLMTPITIQIALSLGTDPLALLIPEVMASNVVGISTLVGTPTNILIGSFATISFSDFLANLTPGVVLAMVGLVAYNQLIYRRELRAEGEEEGLSDVLLARLEERGKIREPGHLRKAAVVGLGMIVLFVLGERIHMLPSVTALMGATALLVWIRPDIEEMIEAVDWTTLVFFIGLFITVGAIQEVGLISFIASGIGRLVGENLLLAMFAVTWLSALLSTVVANIPFTAAMLPVVGFLSATVPGADNKVLFYCLSIGSAMGGNGSLIGASANMVTAGIAERAGWPVTYGYFLRKGFPALLITVALAMVWLLLRFH